MRLNVAEAAPGPYKALRSAETALGHGPLSATIRELVKIRVSQINGCVFCVTLHSREAQRIGITEERLTELPVWQESELFNAQERAALDYAEAVTRGHLDDERWEALREELSEEEIGYLAVQVAHINALNRIGAPMRMKPPRR
ncbi:carboxymuconolactone decarboxylase family protein [Saccharopolyspora taberi]|uniref:Carboxymuconolactone decarboxylase family protein n=1 Tax=Saccharopolyspora taberi TaxID=60895 RepID=A0ABN3VNW8_9PSEU